MNKYILFMSLVLVSLLQNAWGAFMLVGGVVLPIVPIYLWALSYKLDFNLLAIFAFIAGLIVDLSGYTLLGSHSLIYLVVITIGLIVERFTTGYRTMSKVFNLLISLGVYVAFVLYFHL